MIFFDNISRKQTINNSLCQMMPGIYCFVGQSSACLDLSRLNWSLVDQMIQRKVDLEVLEGMGRAVHTNYYAKFNCECLKVIVG